MNTGRILLLLVFGGFLQCTVPAKVGTEPIKPPLPETFGENQDSVSSAEAPWREYFKDTLLIRLIDAGTTNNFDAQIAVQRIEQARAQLTYRKGLLLPALSAGGSAALRRYGLYTMDGAGNATTDILPGQRVPENLPDYSVGIQLSGEADITGKLKNQKAAAASRLLASQEEKNWLTTTLTSEIAQTYYELVTLDQELELTRLTRSLQENALEVITAQKDVGRATELAVQQFSAQVQSTRSVEIELRQQVYEFESKMNLLLGRLPGMPVQRSATLDSVVSRVTTAGLPIRLLTNRADIRKAEFELAAAQADIRAARAAYFPNLQVTGAAGFQAYKTSLLFESPESAAFTLLGGLWAPILNRSSLRAEFNSANASQREALLAYHKTVLTAATEVSVELNKLDRLSTQLDQKTAEVNHLTRAIDTSIVLYRTGRATYLEVLLTQQSAFLARMELLEIKQRALEAGIRLYKSLGGGWR